MAKLAALEVDRGVYWALEGQGMMLLIISPPSADSEPIQNPVHREEFSACALPYKGIGGHCSDRLSPHAPC